jgi:hypothetical protein
MPWEPEHNRNSLSPHGIKEMQGHAARTVHDPHSVGAPECPPGILGARPISVDPHARGDRGSPYADVNSHRPRGEPREIRPPHTVQPHHYGRDDPRESDVISARRRAGDNKR